MIPFSLHAIAQVLNAKLFGDDYTIRAISTDSRVIHKENCLFIALIGNNFNGHYFAEQAITSGAVAILVNHYLSSMPASVSQLVVADTRSALGQLAAWVRKQVPTRVVALTGSSGKTLVKEMTASILRQYGCGKVLVTSGNLNNDIGVPLTLLRLTHKDNFGVIELGANHIGEIRGLTDLVKPETVLVNNIFAAHLTGFGSLTGVAQAKGEIFANLPDNGRAIINADSNAWPHWQQMLQNKSVWRFALKSANGVDFFPSSVQHYCEQQGVGVQQGLQFILHSPQGDCLVRLPLLGLHNIANALAASALALSLGATLPAVCAGLCQFQVVPGRLCPIAISNGKLLLDDSYNANVGSMIAAIKVLAEMPGYKVLVVGDMAELGDQELEYHRKVGEAIADIAAINNVLSVGRLSKCIVEASGRGEHFHDKESLIRRLIYLLYEHVVITVLVKGSRSAAMEQIVLRVLQEQEQAPC